MDGCTASTSTEQQRNDNGENDNAGNTSTEGQLLRLLRAIAHGSIPDGSFQLQPFTASADKPEIAAEWLEHFEKYTDFRDIQGTQKLKLFHLLMQDSASVWLRSLNTDVRNDWPSLIEAFKKHHEMTTVEKLKRTSDIWFRKQQPTETVIDYITYMQDAARKINMDSTVLVNPLINGLRPELRLHVLHSGAQTVQEVMAAARVSEAAYSMDKNMADPMADLTSKVRQVLQQIDNTNPDRAQSKMADDQLLTKHTENESAVISGIKHVTFAPTNITRPEQPQNDINVAEVRQHASPTDSRRADRRQWSPTTSRGRRTSTGHAAQRRQPTGRRHDSRTRLVDRDISYSSTSSRRRSMSTTDNSRYIRSTSLRTWQSEKQPYHQKQQYATALPNCTPGNCRFCGRAHQYGRHFCYATNLQCFACSRYGHVAKMCESARYQYNYARDARYVNNSH